MTIGVEQVVEQGTKNPSLLNRARVRELMEANRLDALVAASAANVTYASGYYYWADYIVERWMVEPGSTAEPAGARAIVSLDGETDLIVSGVLAANAEDLGIFRIYTYGGLPEGAPQARNQDDAVRAMASALGERGLDSSRVGVDLDGMAQVEVAALLSALPDVQFLNCSNLWRLARAVKTESEITLLRRAAEISEQAAFAALAQVTAALSCGKLTSSYRRGLVEVSADFDHFMVGRGGAGIVCEPIHDLNAGDVVFVDYGCRYRHLFSDSGLTVAIQPVPKAVERYAILREAIDRGVAALSPGRRASSVFTQMNKVLSDRHLDAALAAGHGIGLQLRDYPIVGPDNGFKIRDDCVELPSDLTIEEGMVVNLEISLFESDHSFQIEQSYVVRRAGAQPLLTQHREAPWIFEGGAA